MSHLTVTVSSRVLFDLEESDKVFKEQGLEAFAQYQRDHEHEILEPGVSFELVRKLLNLNTPNKENKRDMIDVVVLSRNSPETGIRIMKAIQHYGLDIERAVFTQGTARFRYAKALNTHLFLSTNPDDVRSALNVGLGAASLIPHSKSSGRDDNIVRIAFDGDAVIFSDEAERVGKVGGLRAFRDSEKEKAAIPLQPGPLQPFLKGLHDIQSQFKMTECPLKLALVTARGLEAYERVMNTLRSWDIYLDEAIFCGGLDKAPFLDAFGADIFFDDTPKNCVSAAKVAATAHVPAGVINEGQQAHF